jgi:hypothetical protein
MNAWAVRTVLRRVVMFVTAVWGKILSREDYLDTEKVAELDVYLARQDEPPTAPG